MMRRQEQNSHGHHHHQQQQPRVLYEVLAVVLNLLRLNSSSLTTISPAGCAWLLLGLSFSLMLGGSVTFFIGFMLMPWVLGFVMVVYVAGIVSTVSMLGRSILCYATSPPSPRKDIPAW